LREAWPRVGLGLGGRRRRGPARLGGKRQQAERRGRESERAEGPRRENRHGMYPRIEGGAVPAICARPQHSAIGGRRFSHDLNRNGEEARHETTCAGPAPR
jgi:hypothetical protein